MRSGKMMGLVLALTLTASSAALAQRPGQAGRERAQRGERNGQQFEGRGQKGGFGMLLKGIEVTDAQKQQLKDLRQKQGNDMRDGKQSDVRQQVKAARERGDTAALRQYRAQFEGQAKQRREAVIADIRNILTNDQRTVFDRNVQEAEQKKASKKGV
jgi:periplasmic protein CpxP/Spy